MNARDKEPKDKRREIKKNSLRAARRYRNCDLTKRKAKDNQKNFLLLYDCQAGTQPHTAYPGHGRRDARVVPAVFFRCCSSSLFWLCFLFLLPPSRAARVVTFFFGRAVFLQPSGVHCEPTSSSAYALLLARSRLPSGEAAMVLQLV